MADLYETLGVDRAADKSAIRRAYRRRAKKAHPDGGGTAEQFGALQHAHDILTDDGRRAKYDATGDETAQTADQQTAEAMTHVATAFDEALGGIERAGGRVTERDVVAEIKAVLRRRKEQPTKYRADVAQALKSNLALLNRFTVKAGGNLLDGMVQQRIADLNSRDAQAVRQLEIIDLAISLVERHQFRRDEPAGRQDNYSLSSSRDGVVDGMAVMEALLGKHRQQYRNPW